MRTCGKAVLETNHITLCHSQKHFRSGYNFAGCWRDSGGMRMSSKKPIVTVKQKGYSVQVYHRNSMLSGMGFSVIRCACNKAEHTREQTYLNVLHVPGEHFWEEFLNGCKFTMNTLNCEFILQMTSFTDLYLLMHFWRLKQTCWNRKKAEVTMNSLLAAVLDLADQDLIEKRVKNNIPEMNWQRDQRKTGGNQWVRVRWSSSQPSKRSVNSHFNH